MYVPDPAGVLRTHALTLRQGGLVVPIEVDIFSAHSTPATPLVNQLSAWLGEAFSRGGVNPALGPQLWKVSQDAGLQPLGMIGIQPHFGPDDPNGSAILAGMVRTALPLIEKTGVASAEEVKVGTLQQRLSEEIKAYNAVFAHPALISAWSTNDQRQP